MEQIAIQLDFFVPDTPISRLSQKIDVISTTTHNVRKSLFAKYAEIEKKYVKQQNEIESLKEIVNKLQEMINE